MSANIIRRSVAALPAHASRTLAAASRPAITTSRPFAPAASQPTQRRSYHEKDKLTLKTFLAVAARRKKSLNLFLPYPARSGSNTFFTRILLTFPLLLDHYNNPRNVGSMQKGDTDVGTGLVGAPACGDVMKLQIRVDPNNDTITDVKFKTFGCGSAIASSSYLTELVRGMTLEQAGRIRNTEIAKELSLPPVKLHCSMLAEDAIKSAISNYYTKNPKAAQTDLGSASAMPKIEVETVQEGSNPHTATA